MDSSKLNIMKAFSFKTAKELHDEFTNDFNGCIKSMADNYNRSVEEMKNLLKINQ